MEWTLAFPRPGGPLGDAGGKGDYYSEPGTAALAADVSVVARALGSAARYPISVAKRQALVDWLGDVLETSRDDRVRSKCAATLLAADKLNLEVARLMIEEERLRIAKPLMATGGGGVTVILEGRSGVECDTDRLTITPTLCRREAKGH